MAGHNAKFAKRRGVGSAPELAKGGRDRRTKRRQQIFSFSESKSDPVNCLATGLIVGSNLKARIPSSAVANYCIRLCETTVLSMWSERGAPRGGCRIDPENRPQNPHSSGRPIGYSLAKPPILLVACNICHLGLPLFSGSVALRSGSNRILPCPLTHPTVENPACEVSFHMSLRFANKLQKPCGS